jgi:hypothetical protein
MNKLLSSSALLFFAVMVAQAQDDGLTARDAFWSASDLVTVAQNPAAKTTPPPATTKKPTKPVIVAKKKTTQPTEGASANDTVQIDPQIVTASGYGAPPHLVEVSAKSLQPLGLRYTLLQQRSGGDYGEVFPETVFHSGDKVKLSVMANQPGFLYIIEQGSSGSWLPLFPVQNAASDSNRVAAGQVYLVPSASDESFQFNQQPGKERLFILLSREPITDLDQVIFGLQHKTSSPASPAQANAPPSTMQADNRINDQLVQKLQSRDLTLVKETSQETKDADYGEKAVYVVSNGTGKTAASSVFSDLVLDHE